MLKRTIAMVLSLLVLLTVLPMAASAETIPALCERIEKDYQEALVATGKSSLGGYCGELASWQLYFSGINDYVIGRDGNKHYDTYCDSSITRGGYRIQAYGADEYTLEEALNEITKNGLHDVYNMLVGFEWTSTEAGAIYGHAVFVYAIIDGIVYFTEGFDTSMNTKEGEAIKVSIAQFVDYYDDWTVFDGIIVFGQKGYESKCKHYASDIFVETTKAVDIMSQPCAEDCKEEKSVPVRQVLQGERLLVTALIENTLGQFYYRVDDSGTVGYVTASSVMPLRFNYEQISLENPVAPQVLELHEDFTVGGAVSAKKGAFGVVRMEVTDINNRIVLTHELESERTLYDLNNRKFNNVVDFSVLEKGYYSYNIYADGVNYYVHDGKLTTDFQRVCLLSQPFRVGKNLPDYSKPSVAAEESRQEKSGWYWEQSNWHYYEHGAPKSGWLTYKGIQYYLQADGAISTGMTTIDGQRYFFSNTGAMRTGWLDTANGTCYLLENGVLATGWQIIEGKRYFFDPNGIMFRDCWFSQSKDIYYLLSDGSAAVGVVRLPGGYYSFQIDGKLRAPDTEQSELLDILDFT